MKGRLNELCQKRRWPAPVYTVQQSGPPHTPTFAATAAVTPPNAAPITSPLQTGPTRKAAEQAAAATLLRRLLDHL